VYARLRRHRDTGDPAGVLGPDAVADADLLAGLVGDSVTDLEAAYAAGWLRWTRYQVLPDGEGDDDLTAAADLLAPVVCERVVTRDHVGCLEGPGRQANAITLLIRSRLSPGCGV
jgi:hypothetical protein